MKPGVARRGRPTIFTTSSASALIRACVGREDGTFASGAAGPRARAASSAFLQEQPIPHRGAARASARSRADAAEDQAKLSSTSCSTSARSCASSGLDCARSARRSNSRRSTTRRALRRDRRTPFCATPRRRQEVLEELRRGAARSGLLGSLRESLFVNHSRGGSEDGSDCRSRGSGLAARISARAPRAGSGRSCRRDNRRPSDAGRRCAMRFAVVSPSSGLLQIRLEDLPAAGAQAR